MQDNIHRVAVDFGMPCSTYEEQCAVFNAIGHMHSWQFKGSKPKSSRWFSWQDTCHEQLREWHGSKLVYMWYLDCYNPDSDQIKNADSFDKLRQASGGGLLLALYSLNQKNWENTHIIQVCTQPCWSAFTRFNTTVKSANDSFNYNLQMQTGWVAAQELQELAAVCSPCSKGALTPWICWADDSNSVANSIWKLITNLLSKRASTYSKHVSPPLSYAKVLSDDSGDSISQMKLDWTLLKYLETSTADTGELRSDLRLSVSSPMRLLFMALEVLNFNVSEDCHRLLQSLLVKLPDSKLIEDLHQRLRSKQRFAGAHHEKVKLSSMQHVQNFSDVLNSRDVNYPSVDEATFKRKFRVTHAKLFLEKRDMVSKKHKLPKHYAVILNPLREWSAITPVSLQKSAAAWQWLREYHRSRLGEQAVPIKES